MAAEVLKELGPRDDELLGRHLGGASPDAFAAIVRRHVDLVYSAARAVVHDRHLAEDVTQTVFLLLVRKADALRDRRDLGGWLFQAATFEARNVLKLRSREGRRIAQLAQAPRPTSDPTEPMGPQAWQEIEPHVTEALESLSEGEREAVVLRYFQRRPYDWIARASGVTEAAARQRVHRALERLRGLLARRGVVASAGALSSAIKLHAVQPAPADLAARAVEAVARNIAPTSTTIAPRPPVWRLGPLTAKAVASLVLATTGVAAVGVVAVLALHRRSHSESMYIDSGPKNVTRPVVAPSAPANIVRLPFQIIPARSYDDHRGTREVGGFIGYINAGDWLRFNRVDLGPPDLHPATFIAVVDCPNQYAGHTIEVRADSLDGPILGKLTIQSTGAYGTWRSQSTPLTGASGVHDLFLRFSGGGWNLDTFRVALTRRPGGAQPIPAVSYNDGHRIQTRAGVICETEDGCWVRYNGLTFDPAVNAVALTYASGRVVPDGKISVRLDGPEGPLLGEMPVERTGSWGSYKTKVVPLQEVSGTRDVVIVFSGQGHGIANLRALQFVRRVARPTTLPETNPTTAPSLLEKGLAGLRSLSAGRANP